MDPLRSFHVKLGRARVHLAALNAAIDSFTDERGYEVVKTAHPDEGVYEFRLRLHRDPPTTEWAMLIGDCVHNMRSALDHLFWALVLRQHPGGSPPNEHAATLPIYRNPVTFRNKLAQIENFVGVEATKTIERLQPFHIDPLDDSALAFIHSRDIIDKHRLLIPSIGLIEHGRVISKARGGYKPKITPRVLKQEDVHDGIVLVTVLVEPPEAVADVELEYTRLSVFFDRGGGRVLGVPTALAGFIDATTAIAREFSDLFQNSGP